MVKNQFTDELKLNDCFYNCSDPKGSILIGIVILLVGLIIFPAIIDIFVNAYPFTIDVVLLEIYQSFGKFLNYDNSINIYNIVIYLFFSFFAGFAVIQVTKSLIVPLIFIVVSLIGFFFLAYFILGETVLFDVFFMNLITNWKFILFVLLPSLLGFVMMKISLSKKSCFVMNGTVIKK